MTECAGLKLISTLFLLSCCIHPKQTLVSERKRGLEVWVLVWKAGKLGTLSTPSSIFCLGCSYVKLALVGGGRNELRVG